MFLLHTMWSFKRTQHDPTLCEVWIELWRRRERAGNEMILLQCGIVYPTPSKLSIQLSQPPTSFPSPSALLCSSKSKFKQSPKASFKCSCTQNEDTHEASYQVQSLLPITLYDFYSLYHVHIFPYI